MTLQRSLQDAFSGRILPGGRALQESGGSTTSPKVAATPPTSTPAVTADGAAQGRGRRYSGCRGRGGQGRGEGLQGAQGARRRLRRQARPRQQGDDDRHQGRPRHPPAHRQAAVRQRVGDGAARRARPAGEGRRPPARREPARHPRARVHRPCPHPHGRVPVQLGAVRRSRRVRRARLRGGRRRAGAPRGRRTRRTRSPVQQCDRPRPRAQPPRRGPAAPRGHRSSRRGGREGLQPSAPGSHPTSARKA